VKYFENVKKANPNMLFLLNIDHIYQFLISIKKTF
jgi:hypothetical protein